MHNPVTYTVKGYIYLINWANLAQQHINKQSICNGKWWIFMVYIPNMTHEMYPHISYSNTSWTVTKHEYCYVCAGNID